MSGDRNAKGAFLLSLHYLKITFVIQFHRTWHTFSGDNIHTEKDIVYIKFC